MKVWVGGCGGPYAVFAVLVAKEARTLDCIQPHSQKEGKFSSGTGGYFPELMFRTRLQAETLAG